MSARETFLQRLVCEIPDGEIAPGFRWYEIPAERYAGDPGWLEAGAQVMVTSFSQNPAATDREVTHALLHGAACVAFEYCGQGHAAGVVRRIAEAQALPICIMHQAEPPRGVSSIIDDLRRLQDTGGAVLKIAFPARDPRAIAVCVEAQGRAVADLHRPVSLTPMGTRWGRIAAAGAGSALVFAPAIPTAGRQSAATMLETLVELDGVAADGDI